MGKGDWHLVLLAHIALLHDHVNLYAVIGLWGDSQPPTCCVCICPYVIAYSYYVQLCSYYSI